MKKIFIYTSIILHITLIIISLFKFNDMFTKTVQDNGHAVFDFVSVGDKSTAPILSPENGKASKTKSYASHDNKETTITNKQNDNIKQSLNNNDTSNEQDKHKKNEEQVTHLNLKRNNTNHTNTNNKLKEKINSLKNVDNKESKKTETKNKLKNSNKNNLKNNKQSSKNNGKALVNLKQNKNSSSTHKDKANKKSFNSFLDNVLAEGDNENTGANAESLCETLTANQIDNIRNTVRKCWHFPAGLKNAEQLVVDVKMELDRNGYVKRAEIVDKNRMRRDSGFKIAAENAQRAVLDPRCNPLPLPKEKYNEWKDLELSFNPKDMVS